MKRKDGFKPEEYVGNFYTKKRDVGFTKMYIYKLQSGIALGDVVSITLIPQQGEIFTEDPFNVSMLPPANINGSTKYDYMKTIFEMNVRTVEKN